MAVRPREQLQITGTPRRRPIESITEPPTKTLEVSSRIPQAYSIRSATGTLPVYFINAPRVATQPSRPPSPSKVLRSLFIGHYKRNQQSFVASLVSRYSFSHIALEIEGFVCPQTQTSRPQKADARPHVDVIPAFQTYQYNSGELSPECRTSRPIVQSFVTISYCGIHETATQAATFSLRPAAI